MSEQDEQYERATCPCGKSFFCGDWRYSVEHLLLTPGEEVNQGWLPCGDYCPFCGARLKAKGTCGPSYAELEAERDEILVKCREQANRAVAQVQQQVRYWQNTCGGWESSHRELTAERDHLQKCFDIFNEACAGCPYHTIHFDCPGIKAVKTIVEMSTQEADARPIEEELAELATEVPQEEWDKLPDSDVLLDPLKRVEELEAELAHHTRALNYLRDEGIINPLEYNAALAEYNAALAATAEPEEGKP